MNSGVTSMTALMAKVDLNGEAFLANNSEEDYVDLVAAYSFWVGLASIFLALVGFGKLAGLTPKPGTFVICTRNCRDGLAALCGN